MELKVINEKGRGAEVWSTLPGVCSDASTTSRWSTRSSSPTRPTAARARARRRRGAKSVTRPSRGARRAPAPRFARARRPRRSGAAADASSQQAGREFHAEAEPQDVPRGHGVDPVAAGPRGPPVGDRGAVHRRAQDQAPRRKTARPRHERSADPHRQGRRQPFSFRAQPARTSWFSRRATRIPWRPHAFQVTSPRPRSSISRRPWHEPRTSHEVILAPVISEKATLVGEMHRQVTSSKSCPTRPKAEIKAAVGLLFKDQGSRSRR